MTRDQSLAAARELPEEDQRSLAQDLLDPGSSDPEIEAAWVDEAVRRREEVRSGKVVGVPADIVFARLSVGRSRRAG